MIFLDPISPTGFYSTDEYNERARKHNPTGETAKYLQLKCAIEYNKTHWANPVNDYHGCYQRAINRRFAIAVFTFVITWVYVVYGMHPALIFTFGVVIVAVPACLYFVTVYVLIPLGKAAIEWFKDWISGY